MSDDLGLGALKLVGVKRKADLLDAVSAPPVLERSIAEASILTVPISDARRILLRSGMLDQRCWIDLDGLTYEYTQARKSGDGIDLVFRDSIATALAAKKGRITELASATSRARFLTRLAREADVPAVIDPALGRVATENLTRGTEDDPNGETSWDASLNVTEAVGARRFTDGRRLVAGFDSWLLGRQPAITVREHHGGVETIDFDYDAGQEAASAEMTVEMGRWAASPGTGVRLEGMGPANGLWLVESVSRPLTSTQGSISLTRKQPALPEPEPEDIDAGEAGEPGRIPGVFATDAGGRAYTASAERGIAWGKKQLGERYAWSAKGPNAWDCSGFVSGYIRAGGGSISGNTVSLMAACRAAGSTVPAAQALKIRGALLFRMASYTQSPRGNPNHVAVSLGNGQTLEARGRGFGVGVFGGASGRGWTDGALVPGF